jgi:hypothetical protein
MCLLRSIFLDSLHLLSWMPIGSTTNREQEAAQPDITANFPVGPDIAGYPFTHSNSARYLSRLYTQHKWLLLGDASSIALVSLVPSSSDVLCKYVQWLQ